MTVHEWEWPREYSFGAQGGPEALTVVLGTEGDLEERIRKRKLPKLKVDLSHLAEDQEIYEDLDGAFQSSAGQWIPFRYFWHLDHDFAFTVVGDASGGSAALQLAKQYGKIVRGRAQGSSAIDKITLAVNANFARYATDGALNGVYLRLKAGTGAGQARKISAYVGATREATVAPDWSVQPDATTSYEYLLYPLARTLTRPIPDFMASDDWSVPAIEIREGDENAAPLAIGAVDYLTGEIAAPGGGWPNSGLPLLASGHFHYLMRFNSDWIRGRMRNPGTRDFQGAVMVEVRGE